MDTSGIHKKLTINETLGGGCGFGILHSLHVVILKIFSCMNSFRSLFERHISHFIIINIGNKKRYCSRYLI